MVQSLFQTNKAHIAHGQTWHQREQPAYNSFQYPLIFLLLPMRALHALAPSERVLAHNRKALLSFWDKDHGLGSDDALAWVEGVFAANGLPDFQGEIWLQTLPRMLGYAFKPVSFWFAVCPNGRLTAVLVEVNNTFGERHCYLLQSDELAWGVEVKATKCFHVSPFCEDRGEYSFRFNLQHTHVAAIIELTRPDGTHLKTNWTGQTHVLTADQLKRAIMSAPLMTFMVIVKIHWQALKLLSKRVPFFKQPQSPKDFIS